MQNAPYRLERPKEWSTSVIFASPHSGRDYSWAFLRQSVLDRLAIRSSEDAYVDQLFESAPDHGATLLVAQVPRAFVDLNRAPDELDPAVIEGLKPGSHNPRILSGLGVIPRVVASGRAIYRGKMKLAEAESRIDQNWHPYHRALQNLISETKARFGEAILVDCHSMPYEAVDRVCPFGEPRPDIVLGDRFGTSASSEIVDQIEDAFQSVGLHVVRNTPFAGAYMVQRYGQPAQRQHAIQIEINRSLYMDEKTVAPNDDFNTFRSAMTRVIRRLSDIGRNDLPMAAE